MSDDINLLITLSDGLQLYRVALQLPYGAIARDAIEYFQEPENKEAIRKLLPLHCDTAGRIVDVDELFDILSMNAPRA